MESEVILLVSTEGFRYWQRKRAACEEALQVHQHKYTFRASMLQQTYRLELGGRQAKAESR